MRALRSHCRRFKTITFDSGTEFHDCRRLKQQAKKAIGIQHSR